MTSRTRDVFLGGNPLVFLMILLPFEEKKRRPQLVNILNFTIFADLYSDLVFVGLASFLHSRN